MVAIKLYNTKYEFIYLTLNKDFKMNLEETFPAFISESESGLYSLPVELPWTAELQKFVGFIENQHTINANIPEYWVCDVESNGVPFLQDAKLKFLSHKGRFDKRVGSYSVVITGIMGLFGSLIKQKYLTDLNLGGLIYWDSVRDSRQFAEDVMKGVEIGVTEKLKFAPMVIEEFFDDTRSDYDNEYNKNQIVNNVIINTAFPDGWMFARAKDGDPSMGHIKGEAEYENYRTIPFLSLLFVTSQIFIEHGFKPIGSFFEEKDFEKIHIFNQRAIEKYDHLGGSATGFDVNTEILPKNHVPKLLIADFLFALKNLFNINIQFKANKDVVISFNKELLATTKIKDFTTKTLSIYESVERNELFESGIKLNFNADSADSFYSDKVKDMKDKNVLAIVEQFSDIAGLTLSVTPDETHFILVKSENYYYNFNTTSSTWLPMFEQLEFMQLGKGQVEHAPIVSPMCAYYVNDSFGTATRQNMVACRQHGSYWNNFKVLVENDFGLRLFYIKQVDYVSSAATLPISFCHNYDAVGNKLVQMSLSWRADDGIYNHFWMHWLSVLMESWTMNANLLLNIIDLKSLNENDVLEIMHNFYLIKKISYSLPIESSTNFELVRI